MSVPRVQRLLRAEGAATIYVADVPPGTPRFAAVQWLGAQGGLHGLTPAGTVQGQRGPNIEGQYYAAFPGHAFEPDRPVDDTLLKRWIAFLDEPATTEARRTLAADGQLTRGEAAARLFALAEREGPEPALPKIVLVGDSIRLGYAPIVAKRLEGKAVVIGPKANGGDSTNVLKHLDEWVIREQPAIVHFNCGIHDTKKSKTSGRFQVPPETYEANLRAIVERIRAGTKATVVFATTTPVLDDRAAQGANKGRLRAA